MKNPWYFVIAKIPNSFNRQEISRVLQKTRLMEFQNLSCEIGSCR
jgi:hypothetical protein